MILPVVFQMAKKIEAFKVKVRFNLFWWGWRRL